MDVQPGELTTKDMIKHSVLEQLVAGKISTLEASERLRLSERQTRRLKKSFETRGAQAIKHGNAGRRPVNATAKELQDKILEANPPN